jgi:hypothetical protein
MYLKFELKAPKDIILMGNDWPNEELEINSANSYAIQLYTNVSYHTKSNRSRWGIAKLLQKI